MCADKQYRIDAHTYTSVDTNDLYICNCLNVRLEKGHICQRDTLTEGIRLRKRHADERDTLTKGTRLKKGWNAWKGDTLRQGTRFAAGRCKIR